MTMMELAYPLFEANQVLTNSHLNAMFDYLDEHIRLTRANLIGIGIACGLEVAYDTTSSTIDLTRGCGVTTEGYLVMEADDVHLTRWRTYTLPDVLKYQPFVNPVTGKQYDLWELFGDDEPDTQPLSVKKSELSKKALVLFVELREDSLRNCSQTSCDDRGAEMTATVRRLLIDVTDLEQVIKFTSKFAKGKVTTNFGAEVSERLALVDLRLPRVDVPSTGMVRSEAVLAAFQSTFQAAQLATRTANALSALYTAFLPLLASTYPTDPFAPHFQGRFGFLDDTPTSTTQVLFMQYYWDLFDDLIGAYDELRWKAVDLMCACCPPEGLFPRHLMAGVLDPTTVADPGDYRHHWVPSPAVGDCQARTDEVLLLFRRLVEMVKTFTDDPPLPPRGKTQIDQQIRITPSRLGDVPPSLKAIPYYFAQDGSPPLYQIWDPVKTARRRVNQNLSYRSNEYTPGAPEFVSTPLRFDLEPNNFLRIEGHLGKNVKGVLTTLLSLTDNYRLPIDVVAVRTGAFDENLPVDLSKEDCRFEDLETLYSTLRAELLCFLCKEIRYFYDLPYIYVSATKTPAEPTLELLRTCAPDYRVKPFTIGRWIEDSFTREFKFFLAARPYEIAMRARPLVGALAALAEPLVDDIRKVDFTAFANRHRDVVQYADLFEQARQEGAGASSGVFDVPGLAGRLDEILFRCRLEPFQALAEEYKRRIRDVKQAQFLSHFLSKNPGIQHKAGVPLGGTFVLVYHELPPPVDIARSFTSAGFFAGLPLETHLASTDVGLVEAPEAAAPLAPPAEGEAPTTAAAAADVSTSESVIGLEGAARSGIDTPAWFAILNQIRYSQLANDPLIRDLFLSLTGKELVRARPPSDQQIYLDAVAGLADGAVIADFFLPYRCCSDCAPIQYTLPLARLRFDADVGCTDADGTAEITITPHGEIGTVSVKVRDEPFEELTGKLRLPIGTHTIVIRDEAGAESAPTDVTVPPPLAISDPQIVADPAAGTYQVMFQVTGGSPPYRADSGTFVQAAYASPAVELGQAFTVTVADVRGCTVQREFPPPDVQPCKLPCKGVAVRRGYRLWVPEARPNFPVQDYTADVGRFEISTPDGDVIDLTADINAMIGIDPANPLSLTTANFVPVVMRWIEGINASIAQHAEVNSDQWLQFEYEPPPDDTTPGTLWITRLACLDFNFELKVTYTQFRDRQERSVVLYSSDGTRLDRVVGDVQVNVHIPPFDGSDSNKCRPDDPEIERCKDVDLILAIEREGTFDDVTLLAEAIGPDQPTEYLWEVQDGLPPLANNARIVVGFDPVQPVEKRVRLTAFTKAGCTVVLEQTINIAQPDG